MTDLAGRIAWVTGAGSGIGEASALALAGAGATLVLTGRRSEPLDAVAARIAASGGTAVVQPGDLTRPEMAGGIVAEVVRRFGRLDLLVNNAGLNIAARAWRDLTPASIDAVLHGNLSAAFYCAAAALEPMRRQRDGLLIHTASWAGKYVSPVSGPAYTAAKHAVVAMSQSINVEEYRERDPVDRGAAGRGRDPDPRQAARAAEHAEERAAMLQPRGPRRAGAVHRHAAAGRVPQRGDDQPDDEPHVWDVTGGGHAGRDLPLSLVERGRG